jgi:hypothetical protein
MTKCRNIISTILSYGFALLLVCDYVLANGGYPTVLVYFHPGLPIVVVFVWFGYKGWVALATQQWRRLFIHILFLAVAIIGSKVVIPILAENSKNSAYQQVKEFLLSHNAQKLEVGFWTGEKDPEVDRDFQSFLSNPDMSAVRLEYAIVPYGRYAYIISPNSARPFELTYLKSLRWKGKGKIRLAPSLARWREKMRLEHYKQ